MLKKMMKYLRIFGESLKLAYTNELTYRASALTFTTLLSLVPMISVFVYLMGHFYAFLQLNALAKDYIIRNFVPTSSETVIGYLDTFSNQATTMPVLSICFLFVTSTLLLLTINDSLKTILQVRNPKRRILYLLIFPVVTLFLPIFIGLIALLSSFLIFIFDQLPLIKTITFTVPLLINTILFSLLYLSASLMRIKSKDIILGGFIAALFLEFAKVIFVVYIDHATSYQAIYGALAAIPIFFIWIYMFWFILLYGACFIKAKI